MPTDTQASPDYLWFRLPRVGSADRFLEGFLWRIAILPCNQCGKEIQEGSSGCPHCGSPVSVAQLGPVYVPQSAQPPELIPALPHFAAPQAHPIYAGFWLRAVAFFIDTLIISFIFTMIASYDPDSFIVFPNANTPSAFALPQPTLRGFLVLFVIMWCYYAFFEASSWQATPGKKALKLYVTDLAGRPITFWRASIRFFARKLSELTFLVGYALAGFTEKKQALHDLLAGCLVLRRP